MHSPNTKNQSNWTASILLKNFLHGWDLKKKSHETTTKNVANVDNVSFMPPRQL